MHNLKESATILQHHSQHVTALTQPLPTRIKDESSTNNNFFYSHHSNPIDNAAAAAAAAAVNFVDQHNRELHHALVASINNTANTINGSINNPAMIKTTNPTVNNINQANAASNDTGLGVENCNGPLQVSDANANLNAQQQMTQQNVPKISSSGRSTPNNTGTAADPAPGKLFVGGLSWQTSSEKLKEYFNMFGTVTDVLIMKDPITQRSRGFGFITFQEPGSVEKVLQVPIHTLDGKKIDPKYATPKNRPRQTNKTKKIFVGGVSQETSAEEVKAYFNQFGTVEETVMLMDQQTKRHRGFGFVTFENEDIVDRVCEIHFHTIKNKKVECKKAQPKDAVSPAAQILQKRIMFGALGMPLQNSASQLITARNAAGTGLNSLSVLPTPTQLHLHTAGNAAMAAAQQAAIISQNAFHVPNPVAAAQNSGFGKLFATLPQSAMHSVRYAPYALPASAAAAAAANAYVHAQQQQHQQQQAAVASQQQHSNVAAAQQSANASLTSQLVTANNNAINANNATHGAGTAAHPLAAAAAQQAALVGSNPLNAAAATYQGYALANVDMQSFQGVDWSSMYGMGMYV